MSGDIVERLRAEVVPCPGKGWDGNGVQHCAECCFGTGVDAATADELRVMVLARDAADEIERLRAAANRTLNAFFCCNGLDNTDLMDAFSEWAVLMNHAAVPEAAAWIAKWEARHG